MRVLGLKQCKVQECAAGNLVFLELSGCKFGHHAPLMRTAYILKPEVRPIARVLKKEQRFIWNSNMEHFQSTTAKDQLLFALLNSTGDGSTSVAAGSGTPYPEDLRGLRLNKVTELLCYLATGKNGCQENSCCVFMALVWTPMKHREKYLEMLRFVCP